VATRRQQSDAEHYVSERAREQLEVRDIPGAEAAELTTILTSYGLTTEERAAVHTTLIGGIAAGAAFRIARAIV